MCRAVEAEIIRMSDEGKPRKEIPESLGTGKVQLKNGTNRSKEP